MKQDIFATVTNSLIEAIEALPEGEAFQLPWQKTCELPLNAATGKHYRGSNIISLWVAQQARSYATPYWATYKQWAELGAQVKKGEKSSLIVFWKSTQVEADEEGEEKETRMFARASYVFNADQVENWPAPQQIKPTPMETLHNVETFIAATGAIIKEDPKGAYYSPMQDAIGIPAKEHFIATKHSSAQENYYSTLLHELTHWTGAEKRLNRDLSGRFGSEAYAAEELVAELGAAFACAMLNITPTPRQDHAHYLASWLKAFKRDKRFLFTAASHAQKAMDYLVSLQPAETGKKAA